MLHIILLILKIIGIILLCILGILIFAILCALFVPVRYRIEVTREEGENSPPLMAYVKITWFLHLVNILIRYPAEEIVRARILIFTLLRIPDKAKSAKAQGRGKSRGKKSKKGKKQKNYQTEELQSEAENNLTERSQKQSDTKTPADMSQKQSDAKTPADMSQKQSDTKTSADMSQRQSEPKAPTDTPQKQSETENQVDALKKQAVPTAKDTGNGRQSVQQSVREDQKAELIIESESAPEYSDTSGQRDKPDEETPTEEKKNSLTDKIIGLIDKIKGFFKKIKETIEKIKAFFKNIQYTIRNLCDKIKSTLNNIQYYREVLESDPFKQSVNLCKDEIGFVLRKLKPDKFEADIIVGLDDPASTGEILAFYGILYPIIGQHVRIAGDFAREGTHIEGWLYIRGRIRAFTFLRAAVKIYFNKDIKALIKLLKKEAV